MSVAVLELLAWLALPSTLVTLALLLGAALLWIGRARAGRALVSFGALLALAPALLPLFDLAALPLEEHHPVPTLPGRVDGIVVLGGAVVLDVTDARMRPALSDGAERLTDALRLANTYPEARLLLTGGSGELLPQALSEAQVAARFFLEHGVEPKRLLLEVRSRDTLENARYGFELARPRPGETWLLVTSAMHLPRAVAAFEAAGWDVLPYPTDYRTTGQLRWAPSADLVGRLHQLDAVVREWVDVLGYRMLGHIPSLQPSPDPSPW